MNANTAIQWTEVTWNPITGCDKISLGCKNCYAETLANGRMQAMVNPRYANGFTLTCHNDLVDKPRKWRKPRKIFVNSMSDLFHEDVPMDFLSSVFKTMNECPQHTFQVLTKRSDVLLQRSMQLTWSDNIWIGVSVENASYLHRVDDLRKVPAAIRFLSLEPLIGPLHDLDLTGIHWVIVGGESGKNHRPINENWVRDIRDKCTAANVPFFFKQWAGTSPKSLGRLVDGVEWSQFP